MAETKKELTPKQLRFCHEYVIDHNATQAAIRAGYSPRSATQEGSRLLTNDDVWAKVQSLDDAKLKRLQASADKVLAEWTNLGYADIGQILWKPGELDYQGLATEPGTVKPLHEMSPEIRRTIKRYAFDENGRPDITFHAKDPSLTNLGKFHKLNRDTLDVKIDDSFADRLRRARERRLAATKGKK